MEEVMPDYAKFKAIKSQLMNLQQLISEYEGGFGESEEKEGEEYGDSEAFDGGSNPPTNLEPQVDSEAEEDTEERQPKKKKMAMMSSMLKAKMGKSKMEY